jgi:hypothetical protein
MNCKHEDCQRRAHSRGYCTTHYRRWRSGQPLEAAIRGYIQVEVDEDGKCQPLTAKPARPRRKRPFAAEYALLAEMGLGRD